MCRKNVLAVAAVAGALLLFVPASAPAENAAAALKPIFEACQKPPDQDKTRHVAHVIVSVHMHAQADSHFGWMIYGHGDLRYHAKTDALEGEIHTQQSPEFKKNSPLKFHITLKHNGVVSVQWLLHGKKFLGREPETFGLAYAEGVFTRLSGQHSYAITVNLKKIQGK